jgi:hypothetical protein
MLRAEKRDKSFFDGFTEDVIKVASYHTSNLSAICKKENLDFRKLSIKEIKFLLTKRKESFFGDITEGSKFSTLEMLCDMIKLRPDQKELRETLYTLFMSLPTDIGEPTSWAHGSITGRDGYIGLLNECLVDIGDDAYLIKLIDELVEKKDFHRFDIFTREIIGAKDRTKVVEYLVEKSKKLDKKYREVVELRRKIFAEWKEDQRKRLEADK